KNVAYTVHAQTLSLSFTAADIDAGTDTTAKTSTHGAWPARSLTDDLELTAVGRGLGILRPALNTLLPPLAPTLDLTIAHLLETVGLSLGEADVQVYGVRCGAPVLVG